MCIALGHASDQPRKTFDPEGQLRLLDALHGFRPEQPDEVAAPRESIKARRKRILEGMLEETK
jgi:hypothetical protein